MKVLITGGTGLIGTELTHLLLSRGYQVAYLSRSKRRGERVEYYQWDLKEGSIEEGAIETADYIIHLAGAGVADERWSSQRKNQILDSRVKSTELLAKKLSEVPNKVKGVVMAVAIGIYGDTGARLMTEDK